MGVRFLTSSKYQAHVPPDIEAIRMSLLRMLTSDLCAIWVQEKAGRIIGMLGAYQIEHPFSGELIFAEMFWWVEPEHRGLGLALYRTFERAARQGGARRIQMGAPSKKVAKIYRRLGFTKLEETYSKELN